MRRILLLISVGLALLVSINKDKTPAISTSSTPSSIALAKHLRAKGAIKYSAYWCPYCHKQNQLFGKKAAAILINIECELNRKKNQLCLNKGILGYPSWEINGII